MSGQDLTNLCARLSTERQLIAELYEKWSEQFRVYAKQPQHRECMPMRTAYLWLEELRVVIQK